MALLDHDLKEPLENLVVLAGKHWPDNKLRLLYEYSMAVVNYEQQRFHRIDDKAIKLLTAVSIVITVFVALAKFMIEDSERTYSLCVYILSLLVFVSLASAWFFYFFSLRLAPAPTLPLDDQVFNLVKSNDADSAMISIHKTCRKAADDRSKISNEKARMLRHGFNATLFAAAFLFILVLWIFLEGVVANYFSTNVGGVSS